MEPHLPSALADPLDRFLVLLERWNRTHALTALPPGQRREELLVDAAALLPFLAGLPSGARVADLGTGRGSPAVLMPPRPAIWRSHSKGAPRASSATSVASTISGPIPSPGISVTGMVVDILVLSQAWINP